MFACLYTTGPMADRSPSHAPGQSCAGGGSPAVPPAATLMESAREFSPRVEAAGPRAVLCDLAGVERLFGDARTIAGELRRDAADRGLAVRVAVAATRTAALLAAHARPGFTIILAGDEASTLAPFPVSVLDAVFDIELDRLDQRDAHPVAAPRFYRTSPMQDMARARTAARRRAGRGRMSAATREAADRHDRLRATLERWGIRTLGDLAALPSAEVAARLGQDGPAWQRLARGEDEGPLVPWLPEERFEGRLDLEWPVEGLEPLSFVLGRVLDPICEHLERRDRAAAALTIELRLVSRETFTRRLQLPVPLRDMRVLRTLALLDLEAHPPGAGIDAVSVTVEPTPGRVLQYSLLERARPAPEQVSTLLARLTALMGDGRCGSPGVPDTFRPGAFSMQPFVVPEGEGSRQPARVAESMPGPAGYTAGVESAGTRAEGGTLAARSSYALRRYRHPIAIRVALTESRPARVTCTQPGVASGRVETCAGPWHTSGEWWADPWHRDEWDVALEDGTICRIFQDCATGGWFIDAVVD